MPGKGESKNIPEYLYFHHPVIGNEKIIKKNLHGIVLREDVCTVKKYKAVSGPKNVNVAKGNTQAAFDMFADIINKEATGGWEYHSMETITVTEKPGCLQQPVPVSYYMLIFVREE